MLFLETKADMIQMKCILLGIHIYKQKVNKGGKLE